MKGSIVKLRHLNHTKLIKSDFDLIIQNVPLHIKIKWKDPNNLKKLSKEELNIVQSAINKIASECIKNRLGE